MTNKCPSCGFEYGEFEVICPRCGAKIEPDFKPDETLQEEEIIQTQVADDEEENSEEVVMPKMVFSERDFRASDIMDRPVAQKLLEKPIFLYSIFIIIVVTAAIMILQYFVAEQTKEQAVLRFTNYASNPQQIPLLNEPKSFAQLRKELTDVENFLRDYMRFSGEPTEKKDAIFSAYLNELEKLPHISTSTFNDENMPKCTKVDSPNAVRACASALQEFFEYSSVNVFYDYDSVYLYPNISYVKNNFSSFLSDDYKEYLEVRSKYNRPTLLNGNVKITPKRLASKVAEYELLLKKIKNEYLKEKIEEALYADFRNFIFTPSIYATTTQEMAPAFKSAYQYFINKYKNSMLRPVVISYYNKQRAYTEENFKSDYPYPKFESNFETNAENAEFKDIFITLRKNMFSQQNTIKLAYVYNTSSKIWKNYLATDTLNESDILVAEPDSNNNLSIYTSTFSPLQELNILRFARLFLINDALYVYNSDKLSLSKLTYNSNMKHFSRVDLNQNEIADLFPEYKVINIDSYSNYNVLVDKDEESGKYIIISRYGQGWADYKFSAIRGEINTDILPNMMSVNSLEDVVVSFHNSQINPEETSDTYPTYRFVYHTNGQPNYDEQEGITNFDEQTANEEESSIEEHEASMMPKIENEEEQIETEEEQPQEDVLNPPEQEIEPPVEE